MIPLDSLTAVHALLASLIASIDKDVINGAFEISGGFFALNDCRVLYLHKQVRGRSMLSFWFFTAWGFWNLYYYQALLQPISVYGAAFLVSANAIYLGMFAHYRSRAVFQDEHAIYLGAESAGYSRNGDQA